MANSDRIGSPSSACVRTAVIVGGGIAGCATALAFRQHGIDDVLIVESGAYEAFQIGETIPPDTRLLMERLQIWEDFVADGHEPCLGSRSAWGEDRVGYNDFLLNPHGTGWHLDRRKFGASMAEKAMRSGAELNSGAVFVTVESATADVLELLLKTADGPRRLRARFVVDATGRRSRLAKALGARPNYHDRLLWIGAVLSHPADADFTRLTMLEAVEDGWWYAARLPGAQVIVAAVTDVETNRRALLHRPDWWLSQLKKTRHMSAWLKDCEVRHDQDMIICAVPSFILDRACGSNWLAVGDAASAYDPITSQGIHKALFGGLKAAAAIGAHLTGAGTALDEYQASIVAGFADYLRTRDYFYELERRWPRSPFWRNRRLKSPYLKPLPRE